MFAEVIIDIKHQQVNQVYDYIVPDVFSSFLKEGMRVLVPFAQIQDGRIGMVVKIKDESNTAKKEILDVLDLEPIISEESFDIIKQLKKNPTILLSRVYEMFVPFDLLLDYEKQVTILRENEIPQDLFEHFKNGIWTLKKQDLNYLSRIKTLEKKGVVKLTTHLKTKYQPRLDSFLVYQSDNALLTPKQQACLAYIKQQGKVSKKEVKETYSEHIIQKLIDLKLIFETKELSLSHRDIKNIDELDLTQDKKIIFDNITEQIQKGNTFVKANYQDIIQPIMLYLKKQIQIGQVLILVPELYMIEEIKTYLLPYFNEAFIAEIGSHQTKREAYINYQSIYDGQAKIILGSRQSIFTDFPKLTSIIFIESHHEGFKETELIYYDSREVARYIAQKRNLHLMYISHVLTTRDYQLYNQNSLNLVSVDDALSYSKVTKIDMTDELKKGNVNMLSTYLKEKIDNAIISNQKILLLMNQKGYAPFVMCRHCGYVPKDPEFGNVLHYYQKDKKLISSYSKYEEPFHSTCTKCKKNTMKPVGSGIEQLEEYLRQTYKDEIILRIDKDSMKPKEYLELLKDIEQSPFHILIGTKMALKTLLRKKIQYVGILLFDQMLKLPNYKALEETYQLIQDSRLIAQNELIIQVYDYENPIFNQLEGLDFYKNELKNRELTKMPPTYQLMQVMVEGRSYLKTYQHCLRMKQELELEGILVVGPYASHVMKDKDYYRFIMILKYKMLDESLHHIFRNHEFRIHTAGDIIWY